MPDLVMLDLDAGPEFVGALQQVWEAGDAIFVLDRRLPDAEAKRVVHVVAPTAVIDASGERRGLDGGAPVEPGDALVVATSGTTGTPKAVVHTHTSVRASALATSAGLGVDPTSDTWLACLPPAHIGGLSVITRSLITGTGLVVQPRFNPTDVDGAADAGATLVSVVTRALNQIDTSKFRKILIGGAAPPADRQAHVVATYGMTETGSGCVYEGWPLDGVEIMAAESGEILLRGPMLLRAYRIGGSETSPLDSDGWFRTGDLGGIDPNGKLSIDGRAGEMIITGGENVWPSRVEKVLESHPAIREAAVVGRRDPEWGARVCAVISLNAGSAAPSLAELKDHVCDQLPIWNAPKELDVVDDLPKTSLGKIKRREL